MSDEFGQALLREFIRALPAALDDDALEELAARLAPHLSRESRPELGLLSAAQAAARANVHVETIRRAIRAGELDVTFWNGRSARIAPTALEAWLSEPPRRSGVGRPLRSRRSTAGREVREYSLAAAFKATA
ncbi:helix-turn-helix domain-containing protein [Conexibacter sp. DBS9H8]|uniref:helix-turn-helix domain-containing protein n=1 Tax=Conexibacter sp. DBS9H8 TaxID=2937801 RepID=UPI00200E54A8|nr:helix-turn-helix domain-containing protein [Conexibacter sp. DBS9H8]